MLLSVLIREWSEGGARCPKFRRRGPPAMLVGVRRLTQFVDRVILRGRDDDNGLVRLKGKPVCSAKVASSARHRLVRPMRARLTERRRRRRQQCSMGPAASAGVRAQQPLRRPARDPAAACARVKAGSRKPPSRRHGFSPVRFLSGGERQRTPVFSLAVRGWCAGRVCQMSAGPGL